jgi:hypothetical protein
VVFHWTSRYIDDVLSNNNAYSTRYIPANLKLKTKHSCTSASYLDILSKIYTDGKLTTQLYDKRDYFNFSTVNFPYLCKLAITHHHLHMMFISHNWFDMQGLVPPMTSFEIEVGYLHKKWCRRGFYSLVSSHHFASSTVVMTIYGPFHKKSYN